MHKTNIPEMKILTPKDYEAVVLNHFIAAFTLGRQGRAFKSQVKAMRKALEKTSPEFQEYFQKLLDSSQGT